MSLRIWKKGEEPPNLFARGTKVRFLKKIQVGDGEFGNDKSVKILAGATGTVISIFPKIYVSVDPGNENPHNIQQIELHRSALSDGMAPLREDGKADLKLVV